MLHQDIVSRQHVIDNLLDKAKNLSQSSPAAKVAKYVGELQTKYEKLCDTSKQMLDKLESSVKDHQQYQDMYQDCQDWLNSSREKVELCADTSGDKMSLQNKLERLKVRILLEYKCYWCFIVIWKNPQIMKFVLNKNSHSRV